MNFRGLSMSCLKFRGCPREVIASLGQTGNTTNSLGKQEITKGGTYLVENQRQITLVTTPNITAWNLIQPMAIQPITLHVSIVSTKWMMSITWRADKNTCRTRRSVEENSTSPVQGAPIIKVDMLLSNTCWIRTIMVPDRFSRREILGHSRILWRRWCLSSSIWSRKNNK